MFVWFACLFVVCASCLGSVLVSCCLLVCWCVSLLWRFVLFCFVLFVCCGWLVLWLGFVVLCLCCFCCCCGGVWLRGGVLLALFAASQPCLPHCCSSQSLTETRGLCPLCVSLGKPSLRFSRCLTPQLIRPRPPDQTMSECEGQGALQAGL